LDDLVQTTAFLLQLFQHSGEIRHVFPLTLLGITAPSILHAKHRSRQALGS
jgi:hypothetical protein